MVTLNTEKSGISYVKFRAYSYTLAVAAFAVTSIYVQSIERRKYGIKYPKLLKMCQFRFSTESKEKEEEKLCTKRFQERRKKIISKWCCCYCCRCCCCCCYRKVNSIFYKNSRLNLDHPPSFAVYIHAGTFIHCPIHNTK